ncbi:Nucleoside-diphosphate-sugar epimerase [Amycolatopsis marina]|uniref:Nucleoside-diphosphate-sugar epimerase n=1 Tax=Amycolatopsis marina TaxID=490629 RepID=A0A1I1C433_9PSEU|nr:NAD-dependent epimerase/dehydratase family protein [Amycolatopsis marina]SFB57435.1 Nucleoside-diphosphate-sugar epimerase [Amycolatopsis marina]
MRVFVTGATGYIGGTIADRLLRAGHEVVGLARAPDKAQELERLGATATLGRLEDHDLLVDQALAADAVINAADSDHRGAVEALVAGLAGSGKPLLHTSGSSIVGTDSRGEASDEVFANDILGKDSTWRPADDKQARVAIDRYVLAAADRGVRTVVLCNTMIYGHGRGIGRDSVQIPALVRQARKSGTVRRVGTGDNLWSNVHVDDMADLYLLALTAAPAGSFYFVENGEASLADITSAIAQALDLGTAEGWDIDAAVQEWGHELAAFALGSNSRVRDETTRGQLGWRPRHSSITKWIKEELAED